MAKLPHKQQISSMPKSPAQEYPDIIAVKVFVNGKVINDTDQITQISVTKAVNQIGKAEIRVALDLGAETDQVFEPLDADHFLPGYSIDIQVGSVLRTNSIFKGIITSLGASATSQGKVEMLVGCSEQTVVMTNDCGNAIFDNKKDSEIFAAIIADCALSSELDPTDFVHSQLVRYQSSSWDFLLARAAANGMWVYADGDKVFVKRPMPSAGAPPSVKIEFGRDTTEFNFSLDTAVQGTLTTLGSSTIKLNTPVELSGFGARFNGLALVTAVHHSIDAGQWKTTLQFGNATDGVVVRQPTSSLPNSEMVPPINGLQNGKVLKIDGDPDHSFRIQVLVPAIDPVVPIWARMAQFYATSQQGLFFMPEINDEVVMGFLNEDPRYPIVLGSMYSSKIKAAYAADPKNAIKAITTKMALKLSLTINRRSLLWKLPLAIHLYCRIKTSRLLHEIKMGTNLK
ncbi:MAG: hypothetical protein IPL65_21540 [Lewinellaceae bacterium]|nr:hypothetical protein [Lewinellaceae bacterium]